MKHPEIQNNRDNFHQCPTKRLDNDTIIIVITRKSDFSEKYRSLVTCLSIVAVTRLFNAKETAHRS
jgi:hypothetical protein